MTRRRAMTLLELLVSLALLGMLAALASLVWGQLRGWAEDTDEADLALRPHRVQMLLEHQWNARAAAGEEALYGRPRGDAAEFAFCTRRPVRFPDWPIVEAIYRIEPATPERAARLVYEETRLGPLLENVPSPIELAPIVLLERVSDADVRYRAIVTRDENGETVSEELWVDAIDEPLGDAVEILYTELRARSRGEGIRWVGIVEPLRS